MKKSKVMTLIKKELLAVHEKMSPKERINAFYAHSRLLTRLFKVGEDYRERNRVHKALNLISRKTK